MPAEIISRFWMGFYHPMDNQDSPSHQGCAKSTVGHRYRPLLPLSTDPPTSHSSRLRLLEKRQLEPCPKEPRAEVWVLGGFPQGAGRDPPAPPELTVPARAMGTNTHPTEVRAA